MKELLNCINEYKPLLDLLNGLVSPVLASTVAYIAYQQWKTNDRKERRESRQEKLSIYKRVKTHMNYVDATREVRRDLYEEFREACAEADFVFPQELNNFLSEIDTNSLQWLCDQDNLDCAAPDADEKSIQALHREMEVYMDTLQKLRGKLHEEFSKHIGKIRA